MNKKAVIIAASVCALVLFGISIYLGAGYGEAIASHGSSQVRIDKRTKWEISDESLAGIPNELPVYRFDEIPDITPVWKNILSYCDTDPDIAFSEFTEFKTDEWSIYTSSAISTISARRLRSETDTAVMSVSPISEEAAKELAYDLLEQLEISPDDYTVGISRITDDLDYVSSDLKDYYLFSLYYKLGDYPTLAPFTYVSVKIDDMGIYSFSVRYEAVTEVSTVTLYPTDSVLKDRRNDLYLYVYEPGFNAYEPYTLTIKDIQIFYDESGYNIKPQYVLVGEIVSNGVTYTAQSAPIAACKW